MIVIMKKGALTPEIDQVKAKIESLGLIAHVSIGKEQAVIGAVGSEAQKFRDQLLLLKGVEDVVPIRKPYKFVSLEFKSERSVIDVADKYYCYFNGSFYWFDEPRQKYVVVEGPEGAQVTYLPTDYTVETVNNVEYYLYAGTYFKPYYMGNQQVFVVAKVKS